MATIAINYGELRSAAGEAKKVSKRLDAYVDSIENTVLRKLDNYSGDRTSNISSAISNARNKRNQLQHDCTRYSEYSNNLKNLEIDCQNTDRRVANRIERLTGTFKNMYDIKTNAILDHIGRFMTSLSNSSSLSRWIGNNIVDRYNQGRDYLKDRIKEWYNYDGGKQWLKGTAKAIGEIALAVIAITAALVGTATGITEIIMAVAAVVGGVIALADGVTNLMNEQFAYGSRQNGNASMGYRLSKLDKFTDTLRTFSDNKGVHTFANVVDGVEFVCDVIDFIHDVGDAIKSVKTIFKNGKTMFNHTVDWAKNGINNIKSRGFLTASRELFDMAKMKTMDGLNNIKKGIVNIGTAFRDRDLNFFKTPISNFLTDFKNSLISNFKADFLDFSSTEKGLKSAENIVKFGQKLVDVESTSDFFETVAEEFILPNIEVDFIKNINLKYDETTKLLMIDQSGKLMWDAEKISLADIKGKFDKAFELGKDIISADSFNKFIFDKIKDINIVSSGIEIGSGLVDLADKFTSLSNTKITIPDVYVPQINIQVNLNIQPINIAVGLAA